MTKPLHENFSKKSDARYFLFIVVYIEFPKVFVIFFFFTSHEEKQPHILVEP